ncbi:MAG: Histidine kinase protein [Patescibacteria group bacterium]|nr:Histidine kinase protein [Patescibacteria group bacterium]
MICPYYPTPFLFFISSEVPLLLYYSHVPILIISIIVAVFILVQDRFSLLSRALVLPLFLFSLWTLFDLITWVNNSSDIIMFVWSFFGLLFVLINFSFFRFLYIFIKKTELPFYLYLTFFILILPIILLTFTTYNLTGFDLIYCASLEGNNFVNYYHGVGILILLYTCFFLIKNYLRSDKLSRPKILLIGIGSVSFLFFFLTTSFLASALKYLGIVQDYQIEQYGYFPMIIFIFLLGYSIIRYKIFHIKLFAVQALVWSLVFLIGSQFFFIKSNTNFVLNGFTFLAVLVFGQLLTKSVKKEIEQKEELQKINIQLKDLIQQRESLVHLITHKVKGSFTRTKYVFAEMLNDSFGVLTPEMRKMATTGLESDDNGIKTIDMVLNASNLQNGAVKYDMKKIDLKEIVLKVIGEKSSAAESKGLKIEKEINDDVYSILGDAFWLKEMVNNFIDNSVKYTKSGTVNIGLKKENNKVIFYVKDTGVGITGEDMKNLFTEGGRGKDSVKVNVDSTGYGLFSVKLIMDAHGGRVWAESEGKDKGSTFFAELSAI